MLGKVRRCLTDLSEEQSVPHLPNAVMFPLVPRYKMLGSVPGRGVLLRGGAQPLVLSKQLTGQLSHLASSSRRWWS